MTDTYRREQEIRNGIEWVRFIPHERRHAVPILMQHGMWHGAWCWEWWQQCFAEWGWETYAISLPGHGDSPVQRPIRLCTLNYYLQFLRAAVDALPTKPILMGHSMGGALTQWYLRDVGNLPAAVLVAPWALYRGFWASALAFNKLDFWGGLISYASVRSEWARTPERAAKALLSPDAVLSPEELHARLTPESLLVLFQHLRPWRSPEGLTTPMLWLGAMSDALIPEYAARRAAAIYPTCDYRAVKGAHNLMMERDYRAIAQQIDEWLSARVGAGLQ